MRASVLSVVIAAVVSLTVTHTQAVTIGGDTFNVDEGFPWVGNTNYRWTLTTDGTDGQFNQPNSGDGSLNNGTLETNLNIASNAWLDMTPGVLMKGTVTQLPTHGNAWLQIGVMTRAQAERAADWYMSGMFNNSAFLTFGYDQVNVGDTAGSQTTIASLTSSDQVDYEFKLDVQAMTASGRVSVNGGTWTSWFTRSVGVDNWGVFAEDFTEAAFFADLYIDPEDWNGDGTIDYSNPGSADTASFGDIQAQVVPVPAAAWAGLMMLSFVGGGRLFRRRR